MTLPSAIPVYDLSAMTAKRIVSYWVRQAGPFLSILLLSDHGETGPLPVVLARILMVPVVAVARSIAWLEEKFSPRPPRER